MLTNLILKVPKNEVYRRFLDFNRKTLVKIICYLYKLIFTLQANQEKAQKCVFENNVVN